MKKLITGLSIVGVVLVIIAIGAYASAFQQIIEYNHTQIVSSK